LPETRHVVVAVARSATLRDFARRVRTDRTGLMRDLRHPAGSRDLVRRAVRHPATGELARAGLLLVPARYGPLGWVATWAGERALRRFARPSTEAPVAPKEPGNRA
jgi:hypothetical protein